MSRAGGSSSPPGSASFRLQPVGEDPGTLRCGDPQRRVGSEPAPKTLRESATPSGPRPCPLLAARTQREALDLLSFTLSLPFRFSKSGATWSRRFPLRPLAQRVKAPDSSSPQPPPPLNRGGEVDWRSIPSLPAAECSGPAGTCGGVWASRPAVRSQVPRREGLQAG